MAVVEGAGIPVRAGQRLAHAYAVGKHHVEPGACVAIIAGFADLSGCTRTTVVFIAGPIAVTIGLGEEHANTGGRIAFGGGAGVGVLADDGEAQADAIAEDLIVVRARVAVVAGITRLAGEKGTVLGAGERDMRVSAKDREPSWLLGDSKRFRETRATVGVCQERQRTNPGIFSDSSILRDNPTSWGR